MLPPAVADDTVHPLPEDQFAIGAAAWGIVSYTRWPEESGPLRVCICGQTANAGAIRRFSDWMAAERASTVQTLDAAENPGGVCDVVYVGQLEPGDIAPLIRQITGKPILSIGEGADFCSVGGMFCLDATRISGGTARFSVNLDAVGRSGLRINPQVLRLSRQLQRD